MLEALTIKNFRGIRELELEDFGRINIFVGKNGSGKTSVLEAVSLSTFPLPSQLAKIAHWRGIDLNSESVLASVFPVQLDQPARSQIRAKISGFYQKLSIYPISTLNGSGHPRIRKGRFELVFGGEKIRLREFELPISPETSVDGIQTYIIPEEILGGYLLDARTSLRMDETAEMLTSLNDVALEQLLLQTVQNIDPRVRSLQVGYQLPEGPIIQVSIATEAGERKLPLSVMGDGLCRTILVLTGLIWMRGHVLIVDEIDSGLHHSAMLDLWCSLKNVSSITNRQIFCVTHNEEMLDSTIEAFADDPDALRIYRIEKREDGSSHAVKINYDRYQSVVNAGFEIR